jgi:DNA-binding Lrp family transcriptional regulator
MKIDVVDGRLLYELDVNARQSLSMLAKKLRINKNVLLYRFNRLRKQGIIKYAFAEINSVGLGYHSFRVFLKLGNFTKEQEDALISFILKQRKLIWFSRVLGKWDIDIVYTTKDIAEFDEFRKELFNKNNRIIEDFSISLLRDIYAYPKTYLVPGARIERAPKNFVPISYVIDEKDEELLFLLTKNAMTPIIELAKKARLSINTVKKKMKMLEQNNVILRYRLFIDAHKLGYDYYKLHITLRHYAETDIAALQQFLEIKDFVIYTDHYIGGEDFEIELHIKGEADYISFLNELNSRFGRIIKDHFLIKFYDEKVFRYLPEK